MAILPLGTANDLARTMSIPTDLEGACTVAANGIRHRIDLGRANDKLFFNVASIGLSVAVARVLLQEQYGISHATFQVEPDSHTGCTEVSW